MLRFLFLFLLAFNVFAFDASCSTYFSPNGGATTATVELIKQAKNTIYVNTYKMTSVTISKALIDASNRNIMVVVIVDKSQVTGVGSQLKYLKRAKVKVLLDDSHAVQHNKVIIVDDKIFQTGSFNLSAAAEKNNAENIIICNSPEGSLEFIKDFNKHLEHSVPY